MIRILAYVLLCFLLAGVAIFATQNTAIVTVKFAIFQSIDMPLGLVLIFSAGLGSVIATILQVFQSRLAFPQRSKRIPFRASKPFAKDEKKPVRKSTSDDFDDDWSGDWD